MEKLRWIPAFAGTTKVTVGNPCGPDSGSHMKTLREDVAMGAAKDRMLRMHELESDAMRILVSTGAVAECGLHPGVYIDQYDDESQRKAYAIGTNMVKEGDILCSRQELMEAIKAAIENVGDECWSCDKLAEE